MGKQTKKKKKKNNNLNNLNNNNNNSSTFSRWVKMREKTACDLDDVAFMFVDATVRALLPSSMRLLMSW